MEFWLFGPDVPEWMPLMAHVVCLPRFRPELLGGGGAGDSPSSGPEQLRLQLVAAAEESRP